MEPKNFVLVFATLLIILTSSTSALPFQNDDQWIGREHVSPFVPKVPENFEPSKKDQKSTPVDEAQERQDYPAGEGPILGPMMNAVFGGKKPFEAISGPYYSSSIGPAFQSGPFSGLGVPLSSGPLGGIMGVPLLFLTRNG